MWRRSIALGMLIVAGCVPASAPPRLLLLITVDTLRADHLGAYGDTRGLTPHLDALAARSLVFRSAYSASSFTVPSVAAILTGRYPEELGLWDNESKLSGSVPTLASALKERGWRTAAVVSNFVLRRSVGLAESFELYDDEFPQHEATRGWPERVAADTTRAAISALAACASGPDDKCFLWVHYQDPHGPYTPPDEWRDRFLESERGGKGGRRILPVNRDHGGDGGIPSYQFLFGRRDVGFYRAGYAGEVGYMDAEVGALLAAVEEQGFGDRKVVAFAADHGESLGEGNFWFAHGEHLSEAIVRVPLFIQGPGVAPGLREDLVSLVDLFPTLLALTGVRDPSEALVSRGRDLLATADGEQSRPFMAALGGASVPRYAIVDGEHKLVISSLDGVWEGRLVHREREEVDLTAAAPQLAAELRARLDAVRDEVNVAKQPELRQKLSEEDREGLRALGYVERAAER